MGRQTRQCARSLLRSASSDLSYSAPLQSSADYLPQLQVLKVPKSDVEVTKGLKSREKTVTVNCETTDGKKTVDPEAEVERIKALLESSINN
jgi:hypothetical protein